MSYMCELVYTALWGGRGLNQESTLTSGPQLFLLRRTTHLMVPTKHSSSFSTSELWATPEGFPWQKWGLLFSIMDLRSRFSLVELIRVVQDVWFNKMFSEAAQPCWNEDVAGIPPAPFGMGLET